ncbi:hypothetical protein AVEN_134046-1 [Araneus ventricosus]|uniref:Uncharacterized protein n=1 Tax=Araneus ventricosus TaxID=182803 RepID=A0A4Y2M491_ARAVE|nr:hypothetical protein AVEN_134046-1 [Araneus ventricosus]
MGNVFADKPWSGDVTALHDQKKLISIKARKVALNFSLDEEEPLPINWLERERMSTLDGTPDRRFWNRHIIPEKMSLSIVSITFATAAFNSRRVLGHVSHNLLFKFPDKEKNHRGICHGKMDAIC